VAWAMLAENGAWFTSCHEKYGRFDGVTGQDVTWLRFLNARNALATNGGRIAALRDGQSMRVRLRRSEILDVITAAATLHGETCTRRSNDRLAGLYSASN
jgi:hypothetical protein